MGTEIPHRIYNRLTTTRHCLWKLWMHQPYTHVSQQLRQGQCICWSLLSVSPGDLHKDKNLSKDRFKDQKPIHSSGRDRKVHCGSFWKSKGLQYCTDEQNILTQVNMDNCQEYNIRKRVHPSSGAQEQRKREWGFGALVVFSVFLSLRRKRKQMRKAVIF